MNEEQRKQLQELVDSDERLSWWTKKTINVFNGSQSTFVRLEESALDHNVYVGQIAIQLKNILNPEAAAEFEVLKPKVDDEEEE